MKLWENFYASTPQLIDNYLLKGVPVNASVLDPGAGKGDICDVLRKRAVNQYLPWEDFDHITDAHERVVKQMAKLKERGYSLRVSVIEINTDLQMILKGKGYPLIHDDFLTFDTRTPYDYIIANFPFSDGDKHLSKALDLIEQNGGELRCLVNAETLRNPYTNLRQQVVRRLEKRGAEVEYLGDMFRSAERPTGVEVAFIRVKAVVDPKFSFLLDELDRAQEVKLDEAPEQALAPREFIDLIVGKYKRECTLLVNAVNEFKAFESAMLAKIENGEEKGEPILQLHLRGADSRYSQPSRTDLINGALRQVRRKYWEALLGDVRFNSQYTSNVLNDLRQKMDDLEEYDFSVFNIKQLNQDLKSKVAKGIEDAILKLFDTLSAQYAYDESIHSGNVHYYNGWRTNKAYKINKRVILPMHAIERGCSFGGYFNWEISEKLNDMVKVFYWLDGGDVDVKQLVGESMAKAKDNQEWKLDLRYFRIKFYSRTAHITFTNERLLHKFNLYGSQRKNWLPPAYGKKPYEYMTQEEQWTVDGFEGQKSYEEVYQNANYYLFNASALQLTSGSLAMDE